MTNRNDLNPQQLSAVSIRFPAIESLLDAGSSVERQLHLKKTVERLRSAQKTVSDTHLQKRLEQAIAVSTESANLFTLLQSLESASSFLSR